MVSTIVVHFVDILLQPLSGGKEKVLGPVKVPLVPTSCLGVMHWLAVKRRLVGQHLR